MADDFEARRLKRFAPKDEYAALATLFSHLGIEYFTESEDGKPRSYNCLYVHTPEIGTEAGKIGIKDGNNAIIFCFNKETDKFHHIDIRAWYKANDRLENK